jgi:aminopeptidase
MEIKMDERNVTLAKNLVNYSCKIQPGERVLIAAVGHSVQPLVKQLIREVYNIGAFPYIDIQEPSITRELMMGCQPKQLDFLSEFEMVRMKGMDAFIGVRGNENSNELADVPEEKQLLYGDKTSDVLYERVDNTKWVVLRYPTNAMAQASKMSFEQFESFYYKVCNLDYGKMQQAMTKLTDLMEQTDTVRITGDETDLIFSIKGINSVACAGDRNIPDGEVFTAPVRNSVNGKLKYNIPSVYNGFTFENIKFEFRDGKIINATSNDTARLNKILDMDEGARYIGEFAFGVNPYIIKPINDILFDEKIMGSFHFTPGKAYDTAFNGNKSKIHWDLICVQTEEYGGGSIYFDDVLIRENGLFVLDELKNLNPENLI